MSDQTGAEVANDASDRESEQSLDLAPARLHAICEALAHPARRAVLDTLRQQGGEVPAGALARRFAHAWSTTTRHLRVLEEAGLIEQRRIGRARLYRLTSEPFDNLLAWLTAFPAPCRSRG